MKIFNFKQILNLTFLFGFILTANLVFSQKDSTTSIEIVFDRSSIVKSDKMELYEVDEKPEFPGGNSALEKFIATNVTYPIEAMNINIEGTVYIKFLIEKDGSVSECTILKSVHELLDNETLRLVKSMPKWKPGKFKGDIVKVWYIIPVRFRLNN